MALPLSCLDGVSELRAALTYGGAEDGDIGNDEAGVVLLVGADAGSTPPPPPPPPSGDALFRLEGPTRIDTAVDISQYQFPDGADEVYLSRQDVFADSISSGSLTRGPILLVPQCGDVPQGVLDEVARLDPSRVGALGGDLAVCDQVLADVGAAAGLS